MKGWSKKVFVIIVSIFMIITSTNTTFVKAADEYVVKVNDQSIALTGGFDNAVQVAYNDNITLTLQGFREGVDSDLQFMYVKKEDFSESVIWNNYINTQLDEGDYYIGYSLKKGGNESIFFVEPHFGIHVNKAKLKVPTGLSWNGNVASFNAVTKTISDGDVVDGTIKDYTVQLYKNDTVVDSQNITTTSYDFSSIIKDTNYGDYTFDVKANVTDDNTHYESSAISEKSISNTYKDTTFPTINEFTSRSYDKFTAKAVDNETGIAAYAFSTKNSLMDEDWTACTPIPQKEETFSFAPVEKGIYYFYVKDAYGNVTKSDTSLAVSEVILHDYYVNSVKEETSNKRYIIETQELDLSTISTIRSGYNHDGWYSDAQKTTPIIKVSGSNSPETIDVYAKWTRLSITFTQQPQPINKIYDGYNSNLSVVLSYTNSSTTYQWYKDDKLIPNAHSSELSVKNVNDSGEYYVVANVTIEDQTLSVESDRVNVTINKKELTLTTDNKEVIYGDEAPIYTYSLSGFVGEETKDSINLSEGQIFTTYTPYDGQYGEININASDFEAPNYSFNVVSGKLNIKPKSAEGLVVEYELSDVVYTGVGITKDIVVKDGERIVNPSNYEIQYHSNVNVGKATFDVIFKNCYTGEKNGEFNITKASFTPVLSISDWKYGNVVSTPSINSNVSGGNVTYYYKALGSEDSTATEIQPVNAGSYEVWAVVNATNNYEEAISDKVEFHILKRTIILTAASDSKVYDGKPLTKSSYTQSGDGFAGTDDFRSVVVSGTQTDVGESDNTITYTLSASTRLDNYDIQSVFGKLTVTKRPLPSPSNNKWSKDALGTATWVGISRANIDVEYLVTLLRVKDDNTSEVVREVRVSTNSYDFNNIIKTDCANVGASKYQFKVQAVVTGGSAKDNYNEISEETLYSELLYTAKIVFVPGVGTEISTRDMYLIAGESVNIYTSPTEGYTLGDSENHIVWTIDNSSYLKIQNNKAAFTKITLNSNYTNLGTIHLSSHASNDLPVITLFEAKNTQDYDKVTFTLKAQDTSKIIAYAFTQKQSISELDDSDWTSCDTKLINLDIDVDADGEYYFYIKDDTSNIVASEKGINVYKIVLTPGEGVGENKILYKAENENMTLPENSFTKENYAFVNWVGGHGIYNDRGIYSANENDTLNATWSNIQYNYTVNYYFMDTNGKYNDGTDNTENHPDMTSTFKDFAGTQVLSSKDEFKVKKAGFTYDASKESYIVLNEDHKTLNVYYSRNRYTITYSYQKPDETVKTSFTKSYYFEQTITEEDKPNVTGYNFVGWTFEGLSGTTMPNANISASGIFVAKETNYTVNYYVQNIENENEYTLISSEEKNSYHDTKISVSEDTSLEMTGFRYFRVAVSHGNASGSTIPNNANEIATGIATTVSDQKLNINYYYKRNSYVLTLNVYKAPRENNVILYTKSIILKYGEVIPNGFAEGNADTWNINANNIQGYVLASYTDWSTGNTTPSTMPAGDVNVSRDYVSDQDVSYKVSLYYQNADGGYSENPSHSLIYYAKKGSRITSGDTNSENTNYLNYETLKSAFATGSLYEFDADNVNNVTSGTIPNEGELNIKFYFKRKISTTTITYYFSDGTGNKTIANYTKSGIWGSTYTIDPILFFDNGEPVIPSDYTQKEYHSEYATTDYRNNSYYITYTGSWYGPKNGSSFGSHSVNEKIESVERSQSHQSLEYTFGCGEYTGNGTDKINIYYTKLDIEKRYYLNINYTSNGLTNPVEPISSSSPKPLSVKVGDATYKVRVANQIDVFNYSYTDGSGENYGQYPVLKTINATYTIDSLREGFTECEIGGYTYYTKGDYLYVVDDTNPFYSGNRASYNFLTHANYQNLGYSDIETYLRNYQENSSYKYKECARIANPGFYLLRYLDYNGAENNTASNYNFYFYYTGTFRDIKFIVGGTICNEHSEYEGYPYTLYNEAGQFVGCTHAGTKFETRSGYEIKWYWDSNYTRPLITNDTTYPVNVTMGSSSTSIYGRYERKTNIIHHYAYYELADRPEGSNGYITINDINRYGADITSSVSSSRIDFIDGAGKNQTINVTKTTYYYKGKLIIVDQEVPVLSLAETNLITSDYISESDSYLKNYHFDEENPNNELCGYVEDDSISLKAYYALDKYDLKVDNNNERVKNVTTTTHLTTETITLNNPSKNGYRFSGWKFYSYTLAEESENTGTITKIEVNDFPCTINGHTTTFEIPSYNVYAEAQFEVIDINQTIIHHFPGENQDYGNDLLSRVKNATSVSKEIQYNNVTYNGYIYYVMSPNYEGLGCSFTDNNNTYYFSTYAIDDEKICVNDGLLYAIEQNVSVTNEKLYDIKAFDKEFDHFTYSYSVWIDNENGQEAIYNNLSTDQFKNTYNMSLDYYYTSNLYNIRTAYMVTDKGSYNGTITGSGEHVYYEDVHLVSSLGEGYTFIGWYNAADVLDNYTGYNADIGLDTYELKSDITEVNKLTGESNYSFKATSHADYIAVIQPKAVDEATVTISGNQTYTYGYSSSSSNVLKAGVSLPENSTTIVTGYQWYRLDGENWTLLENENSSTHLFSTGKEVGSYVYKCKVTLQDKNNGRVSSSESPEYTVNVVTNTLTVNVTNYTGVYDGNNHGITIAFPDTMSEEYKSHLTIYYSDHPLTSDNYSTMGQASLTYKDVNVNENGEVVPYTVYYYIKDSQGNYDDVYGSGTVTINPKSLVFKATDNIFEKVYDGSTHILGDVNTPGSDKYRFVHESESSYYIIEGMVEGDKTQAYLLNFDGNYNSAHEVDATTITLTNLRIVAMNNNDEIQNHNYTFVNSSVTILGRITPFILNVNWDTTRSFVYNTKTQAPSVAITNLDSIPECDRGKIKAEVEGAQTHVGNYQATVVVKVLDGAYSSDYSFSEESVRCDYSITPYDVKVNPRPREVEYNSNNHSLNEFDLLESDGITPITSIGGTIVKLSRCDTSVAYKNAGTYGDIEAKNALITIDGKDVTDNFNITYGKNNLTITKKAVIVNGITAENKVYDGNTNATLNIDHITFGGIIEGDDLSISSTGAFVQADCGTDINVQITYGALTGASAGNYTLNSESSQQETKANITEKTVKVKFNDISKVYGDEATYSINYDGLIGEMKPDESAVKYKRVITNEEGEELISFDAKKLNVSNEEYSIQADISHLSLNNYVFALEDNGRFKMEVMKRPVQLVATGESISKVYDNSIKATVPNSAYKFTGIDGNASSGIVNDDTIPFTYSANYQNKNVNSNNPVTISNIFIQNNNYVLQNNTLQIPGSITKRNVTLNADNKTITYGDNAPAYTFTARGQGMASGETISNIFNPQVSCLYNIENTETRKAGEYAITFTYTPNDNYNVTVQDGKLIVNKATLSVSANNQTMTYGDTTVPANESTIIGYKYSDTKESLSIGINYSYNDTIDSHTIPGTYSIIPECSPSLDNYQYSYTNGTLIINKANLKVSGISVENKVYDGKTIAIAKKNVSDKIIATYEGLKNNDSTDAFVADQDIIVNAEFDDKNVGENKAVQLTIQLNDYLNLRYVLTADSQTQTTATIYKGSLTIKANDITVKYGEEPSGYSVTYDGFKDGDTVNNSLSGTLSYSLEPEYSNTKQVGTTYSIKPSGLSSSNYNITYTNGTLTVVQNQLSTPVVTWDTLGRVKWNAISSISEVNVDNYTVKLYKDNVLVDTKTTENTEYDWTDKIRENGKGQYTVGVIANASTTNNMNKVNVLDSFEGKTVNQRAASSVHVKFAQDEISSAGGVSSTAKVNSQDSYIMLSGESNVPFSADILNDTGYSIESVITNAPEKCTISNTELTGVHYTGKVDLASDAQPSDITITIKLNATPATVNININPFTNHIKTQTKSEGDYDNMLVYGYGDSVQRTLTTTLTHASGENSQMYKDITYKWEMKDNPTTPFVVIQEGTQSSFDFPIGKVVSNYYRIKVTVTATRKDNNQTTQKTSSFINVEVIRADFTATISMENWTYGEFRKSPTINYVNIPEADKTEVESSPVTYQYSTDGTNYSNGLPTEAGTYQVRAVIAQTTNYNEYATQPITVIISKAILAKPKSITMEPSSTMPFGKYSWLPVEGPKENNGVQSTSQINVTYQVGYYFSADGIHYEPEPLYRGIINSTSIDLSQFITRQGTYEIKVKAIANNVPSTVDNCKDSQEVSLHNDLKVSGTVTANQNNVTYGEIVQLTANFPDSTGGSYEWYYNGNKIDGQTTSTLDLTHVSESGRYTCDYVYNETHFHATYVDVKINKKALEIKVNHGTSVYGDTPEITYTTNPDTGDFPYGEKVKVILGFKNSRGEIVSSIAERVASVDTYTIEPSIDFADTSNTTILENDYDISYVSGTYTITRRPLTITATNESVTYTGSEITYPVNETETHKCYVVSPQTEGQSDGLVSGHHVTSVSYSGGGTNVDANGYTISVTNVTIKDSSNTDVTSNYNITKNNGKLTVTKRNITVSPIGESKVYNGQTQYLTNFEITGDGIVTGQTYTAGTDKGGINVNQSPYTITAQNMMIKQGENDVTSNYNITYGTGELTITPRSLGSGTTYTDKITVDDISSVVYTGNAQKPAVTIKDGISGTEVTLTENDYSVSYSDNVNAGIATITMTGQGNYSGSITKTFSITKAVQQINASDLTVTYDGTTHSINATAQYENATITYENNGQINAGVYTVTINAAETTNYQPATKTVTLKIDRRPVTITATNESVTYTGSEITYPVNETETHKCYVVSPQTEGQSNGLISGHHVTSVTYSGGGTNVDANGYTISVTNVTIKDSSNTDVTSNYNITKNNGTLTVTKRNITVSPIGESKVYNGQTQYLTNFDITGDGIVTGQTYTAGTDKGGINVNQSPYTITAQNMMIKQGENDVTSNYNITYGTGKLTITPRSLGSGTTYTDKITVDDISSVVYTGNAQKPAVTIKDGISDAKVTLTENDYSVSYSDNVNAGTATITMAGKGNYSGSITKTFSITKADNLVIINSELSKTYDSVAISHPTDVTRTDSTGVLTFKYYTKSGDVYSELSEVPKDSGTYYVKAFVEEVANYKAGESDYKEFTISKADNLVTINSDLSKTYDSVAVSDPTDVTRTDSTGALTFKYYTKSGDVYTELSEVPKDAGTYYVKAFVDEVANYKAGESDYKEFTISKADNLVIINSELSKTYDSVAISHPTDVTRTDSTGVLTFKYYTKSGDVYTELSEVPKDAGTYYVKAFVDEVANYKAGESDYKEFTISKADNLVTINSDLSKTYDSVSVSDPTDVARTDSTGVLTFKYYTKSGDVYTELSEVPKDAGTYYVKAFVDEVANYKAGESDYKEFTISKADLVYCSEGYEGVYDDNDHGIRVYDINDPDAEIYYSLTSLNEQNYKDIGSKVQPVQANAGTYTVYFYIHSKNFFDQAGSETITIDRANLIVKAKDHTITYGDQPDNNGYIYEGLVGDDKAEELDFEFDYSYTYEYKDPIGEYDIQIASKSTRALRRMNIELGNYRITSIEGGTLTVKPKQLTIQWSDGKFIFDGSEKQVYPTIQGIVEGDIITYSIEDNSDVIATNVNRYIARIKELLGTAIDNYIFDFDELSFDWFIEKAPQNRPIVNNDKNAIDGLTTDMEYRLEGSNTYIKISDPSMKLPNGVYYVRYFATDNYFASDDTKVVIDIKDNSQSKDIINTGDDINIMLPVITGIFSGLLFVILGKKRKTKESKNSRIK